MTDQAPSTGLTDNAASAIAYITFIPAIVFLATPPYNQSATVRFHSWQSIFLSIAAFAVWLVLFIIGLIPVVNLIDIILFPVVGLGFLVLWIWVLVQAVNGKRMVLPIIGALAQKQAGS